MPLPSCRRPYRLAALALGVAAALSLAACGKKDEAAGGAPTQVAAKVGSEEISVHQINQVLSRSAPSGASQADVQRISRDILEKLIDQQLLVDQAKEAKLDRTPDVVAQMEAAKRDILARAYAQQLTGGLPKPTPEDVKKYYAEHPALFAERRVFNVQELVIPGGAAVAEQLRAFASANKSLDEVAAFLKGRDIKYQGGSAQRPAEQIPLELLGKLQPMKDGQCILLEASQAVTYVRIASSQNAPVSEAQASANIAHFLANQRGNEAVGAALKKLRSETKISYQGEFANAPAAAAPAAPAATTDKSAPDKAAIDKGLSGLK